MSPSVRLLHPKIEDIPLPYRREIEPGDKYNRESCSY